MKRLLTLGLAFLLAGCNSQGSSSYGQFFQLVRQSVTASFGKNRITKDQAAAIPYASMGYRINDGQERLLVLATDNNGDLLWTSAQHIVLVTRDGRVVRTVGLTQDIAGVTPVRAKALPPPSLARDAPLTYSRQVDLPAVGYGTTIACTAVSRGLQTIVILGQALATLKIDESCQAPSLNWSFTDSYWIDRDSGLAWRTIQHLGQGERIETEILRPPG